MGRKKVLDGKLVSIGAKVTKRQMEEIEKLQVKLDMNSRSDLLRAALASYLCNPPQKFGENECITDASKRDFDSLLGISPSFKELGISLNDALSRWKALDECSRLDTLVPCSNAECPKRGKPENN